MRQCRRRVDHSPIHAIGQRAATIQTSNRRKKNFCKALAQMFHKYSHSERVLFINTLLQRGVGVWWRGPNRFSGFRQWVETVETVLRLRPAQNTPLKQGVNDRVRSEDHRVGETI